MPGPAIAATPDTAKAAMDHALDAMVKQASVLSEQILALPATGPDGTYTPEEADKLNALFAARHEIHIAIIAYNLAEATDLNSSAAVKKLTATVTGTNAALKKALKQVNDNVGALQNLSGFLSMLDTALKAVVALG